MHQPEIHVQRRKVPDFHWPTVRLAGMARLYVNSWSWTIAPPPLDLLTTGHPALFSCSFRSAIHLKVAERQCRL